MQEGIDIHTTNDESSIGEKELLPVKIAVVNPDWQNKLEEI